MSYKSYNERTVTLKLERREVCRLQMACTLVSQIKDSSPEWKELHDKIYDQLFEFDQKNLDLHNQ